MPPRTKIASQRYVLIRYHSSPAADVKSKKGKKRVASTPAEKKTTGKKAKKGNQKESTVSADEESDDIVPKKEDGDFAEDSVDMEFA